MFGTFGTSSLTLQVLVEVQFWLHQTWDGSLLKYARYSQNLCSRNGFQCPSQLHPEIVTEKNMNSFSCLAKGVQLNLWLVASMVSDNNMYIFIYLSIYLFIHLFAYLHMYVDIWMYIHVVSIYNTHEYIYINILYTCICI